MAEIAKWAGTGNIATIGGCVSNQVHGAGFKAGETITMGEACYVKTSDGKVYRAFAGDGTTEADNVRFFALDNFEAGQDFAGVEGPINIGYSDGTAAKGINVYLAASTGAGPFVRGRLADAPAFAGQKPLGWVLPDGKTVRIFPAH